MEAFLVGRCGLTQEQAGWVSVQEYRQRAEGAEMQERARWERARWQMYLMMQMHPNIKPHQKPKTPQAFARFPWETDRRETIQAYECRISGAEQQGLDAMLTDFMNRRQ